MRCGECLVQIYVHHVKTHVTRSGYAEHRVEVCSVIVHKGSGSVYHIGNPCDIALEYAGGVRICHHDRRHAIVEHCLKRIGVNGSVGQAFNLHNFQPGNRSACGVCAVSRIGHYYLCAGMVAPAVMVGAYDHKTCQLAVRAGKRVEREFRHAADFGQGALQSPVSLKRTLSCLGGGVGVKRSHCGQRAHFFVDFRVVLHGA